MAADGLIVARATPPGKGAIAVVRLSGPGAIDVATSLSGRDHWVSRRATRTRIRLAEGRHEDALVTVFREPASYTGEDLVEFSVHGSVAIVDGLLDACVGLGARLARPGEFTYRAYLNGKLDLLQAEAVADLVDATTLVQVGVASAHLDGDLSRAVTTWGDAIAQVRTLLEASLDFPDEGFHFIDVETLAGRLRALADEGVRMLGTANAGRRLHEGATVVLTGRPNAGKSSLFNALLRRQRAIVSAAPGTTRDLITESTTFGGVPVTLVDSAGLRDSDDVVERVGVERAEDVVAGADVVILVVDPSASGEDLEASRALFARLSDRVAIAVASKADVRRDTSSELPEWWPSDALEVSATTGEGIELLESRIASIVGQASWEGTTLTRARHRSLVSRCVSALECAATTALNDGSEEFVLVDVQDALRALEELRGVETPDDVLADIFGRFCIGK